MTDLGDITALTNMITDAQKAAEEAYKKKAGSQSNLSAEEKQQQKEKLLQHRVEETLGVNFKAPKYDIIYKQQVEASEVYGGFQQMTPSTIDSQYLVIKIQLPNETMKNIDVELTQNSLTLFGKYHRLYLELPNPVNEKSAKARWNKGVLEITARRTDIE